jgi:hypothetical protein
MFRDLTRMSPIHGNNRDEHWRCIEAVQENLMSDDIPEETFNVLHASHNRPHEDQNANDIETSHMFLPWSLGILGIARQFDESVME